ncbi:hypothetical protein [Streptosporangium sp. LJ11]|uniref:hypothetical protein n=1 Tax=Streptosporangium sp. LJ11 TaxID=3436927 RepID=UPI003F7AF639
MTVLGHGSVPAGTTLLDCTLRDGNYQVKGGFTQEQTCRIFSALQAAGISFIEVGHGLGMGSGRPSDSPEGVSDESYMRAAASVAKRASWGMFFQPSFSSAADVRLAADYGMGFIRIGVNVTETDVATSAISCAKDLGLLTFVNLMKSYVLSAEELAERAAQCRASGADAIYLVDSAGGMLPHDVMAYVAALRSRLDCRIGFHAHNNLGLANANCLAAWQVGASFIDVTLRGVGRASGNAIAEQVVAIMCRLGADPLPDLSMLVNAAADLLDPIVTMLPGRYDAVSGFAQFHSSNLTKVIQYAHSTEVDPIALIVAIAERDKIDVSDELLAAVGSRLAAGESASG